MLGTLVSTDMDKESPAGETLCLRHPVTPAPRQPIGLRPWPRDAPRQPGAQTRAQPHEPQQAARRPQARFPPRVGRSRPRGRALPPARKAPLRVFPRLDQQEVSKVRLKAGGAEVQVRATDVSLANPVGLTAPDNTMLLHLSEAALLENVRARYMSKEIYTLTGSILLAMNPFERLPIYSEAQMAPYKGQPLGRAPAHVYGERARDSNRQRSSRERVAGHACLAMGLESSK